MAEDERLAHLVDRLYGLTRAGHVRWELAEDRDDAFTYGTRSGAVVLFSRDRDGRDPYVLTIRDARDRLVERVDIARGAGLYERVADLYAIARRQALGTHAVVDGMLRDLSAGPSAPSASA
jgi:hypothetical protein